MLPPHFQLPPAVQNAPDYCSEGKGICVSAGIKIKEIASRFNARQGWCSADKYKASSPAFQPGFRRHNFPSLQCFIANFNSGDGATPAKREEY